MDVPREEHIKICKQKIFWSTLYPQCIALAILILLCVFKVLAIDFVSVHLRHNMHEIMCVPVHVNCHPDHSVRSDQLRVALFDAVHSSEVDQPSHVNIRINHVR